MGSCSRRLWDSPIARNWLFELEDFLPEQQYVKVMVTMLALGMQRETHEDKYEGPFVTCKFIENYLRELQEIDTPLVRQPRGSFAP